MNILLDIFIGLYILLGLFVIYLGIITWNERKEAHREYLRKKKEGK